MFIWISPRAAPVLETLFQRKLQKGCDRVDPLVFTQKTMKEVAEVIPKFPPRDKSTVNF